MPKVLDSCVKQLTRKGHSRNEAYAMCVKSTGYKKKKGGGWTKSKKRRASAYAKTLREG